ncbi:MAG: putative toxin-antitoxin system toxin component, PIN family [Chloroflexota bacterium]
MRAVIDTNVYVSFLLSPRGAGAWLIAMWRDSRFDVVVSPALHQELVEVMERPEIAPKVDAQRRIALLYRLRHDALWAAGKLDTEGALADSDDDFLLGAALEREAQFIVTWDGKLLEQGNCQGAQIVTPDQFIALLVRSG